MHRVIVVGSPRHDGRSALLADELFNACIEECPTDGVSIVSVASLEVGGCRGCDACRVATEAPDKLPESDDNLAMIPEVAENGAVLHRCVIHDDMTDVRKHLDAADELIVVSPVYFAGAPSQLKALMDRLQPYYWSGLRRDVRRPMVLHVVGEGDDPHGFEPLIGSVRSAFSCAGFELELVLDWVGKIEDGEIVAEAEEYPIPPVGGFGAFDFEDAGYELLEFAEGEDSFDFDADDYSEVVEEFYADAPSADRPASAAKADGSRPSLTLGEAGKHPQGKGQGGSNKAGKAGKPAGKPAGKAGGKAGKPAGKGNAGKASYGKNKQVKAGKRRG